MPMYQFIINCKTLQCSFRYYCNIIWRKLGCFYNYLSASILRSHFAAGFHDPMIDPSKCEMCLRKIARDRWHRYQTHRVSAVCSLRASVSKQRNEGGTKHSRMRGPNTRPSRAEPSRGITHHAWAQLQCNAREESWGEGSGPLRWPQCTGCNRRGRAERGRVEVGRWQGFAFFSCLASRLQPRTEKRGTSKGREPSALPLRTQREALARTPHCRSRSARADEPWAQERVLLLDASSTRVNWPSAALNAPRRAAPLRVRAVLCPLDLPIL